MVKAIFSTKILPAYDDLPESRYHFPRTYLNQVQAAVGDWIIYYEPRRSTADRSSAGGRSAYFAAARLDTISADSSRADHYYAHVSQFLEFIRPVPFLEGGEYYESSLRKDDGTTNKGAFGRAVRSLPDEEYQRILKSGFALILAQEKSANALFGEYDTPNSMPPGLAEADPSAVFGSQIPMQPRRIVQSLISRPFRDRAFAGAVKSAYRDTCAITGLRIVNGGGRSEVQAAHIRPVAADGPDSVRNGLALSSTVHWMFDRGLISIDDDYSLLIARDRLPDTVHRLLPEGGRVAVPEERALRPHRQFLEFHRDYVFKG